MKWAAFIVTALRLAAQPSPTLPVIPLPNGVTAKTIATVTSTCVTKQFSGSLAPTCTSHAEPPSFLGLVIGNMADAQGVSYGIAAGQDGSMELYATSSEGTSKVITAIGANSTCMGNGSQATKSSRGMSVLGYNLGAQSLYLSVFDNTETEAFSTPQPGISIGCSPDGGFQISLLPPGMTQPPSITDTTISRYTVLKLTGRLGFDGPKDR